MHTKLASDANSWVVLMSKNELKQDFLKSTGNVIYKKRRYKNITQEELGKALGVSASTISRYEKGTLDIPVSNLPLISNYCDFKLRDYLIEWESIDIGSFIKDALTYEDIVPDHSIVNEFIDSCDEAELLDIKEIKQCVDNLQSDLYKHNLTDIFVKEHMKTIVDSRYERLVSYYCELQKLKSK